MNNLLRRYIRYALSEMFESHHEDEDEDEDKKKKNLLIEPDDINSVEKNEMSGGGVAGAMTPMGTDSTYPNKKRKKKSARKKVGKKK